MRFCLLASGSTGNCLYVEEAETRVLIDAGISLRRIRQGLAALGVPAEALSAVCVTHDHSDHIAGLRTLCRRHRIPIFATEGTSTAADCRLGSDTRLWQIFSPGDVVSIGALRIETFTVPHDAGDPVGLVLEANQRRLGVLTDLGFVPAMVTVHARTCHALVLETNHDVELLRASDRPWSLKERILGRHGHLSNEQSAEFLSSLLPGPLATLVLAHLSEECNTPALARHRIEAVLRAAGCLERIDLHLASTLPTPLWPV